MANINLENIWSNNVFVYGGINCKIMDFFEDVCSHLHIKKDIMKAMHPMHIKFLENMFAETGHTFNIDEYIKINLINKPLKPLMTDSVIFVIGSCGLTSNSVTKYIKLLKEYNKILAYNNTYVIFIRGENDNPLLFDNETINLSNIKAVADYTVVKIRNKNILCIGGATTIERAWKLKHMEYVNRLNPNRKFDMFCGDTSPKLDNDKLNKAINDCNNSIDYVFTCTAPSFCQSSELINIEDWEESDEKIRSDLKKDKLIMTSIFSSIISTCNTPEIWVYNGGELNTYERRSDMIFMALPNMTQRVNIGKVISLYKENEKMKKIKRAEKRLSREKNEDMGFDPINLVTEIPFDNALPEMVEMEF